eukprot:9120280-Alexandrium_andersonii.AAC.1
MGLGPLGPSDPWKGPRNCRCSAADLLANASQAGGSDILAEGGRTETSAAPWGGAGEGGTTMFSVPWWGEWES